MRDEAITDAAATVTATPTSAITATTTATATTTTTTTATSTATSTVAQESAVAFFDIAVNLADEQFRGIYNRNLKHEDDTQAVVQRAAEYNVKYLLVTAGSAEESKKVQDLCVELDPCAHMLFSTAGVHPTSWFKDEKQPQENFDAFLALEDHPRVLAWGEMGLDYDRLEFCNKEVQVKYFEMQLKACVERNPDRPFFLHLRGDSDPSACEDFVRIIKPYNLRGVVHSFTGTEAELRTLLDDFPSLFIGVNGCSLKDEEKLKVVSQIPLERMMLETDSPYCVIRPKPQGHQLFNVMKTTFPVVNKPKQFEKGKGVKDRNEPCRVWNVAEVVAHLHKVSLEHLASICYRNTCRMFLKK